MTRIIDMDDPAHGETAYEFQGHDHDAGVSCIVMCIKLKNTLVIDSLRVTHLRYHVMKED